MISSDSTHGSIWLKLSDDHKTFKKRSDVIDFLKSSTSGFDWDWTYSGIPIVRNTYVEYMIQDNIKFLPPVALILVFALSFLFRNWIYVILPLITVLITAVWILGIMSITGEGDSGPVKVGVAWIDIITGLYAGNAILAALFHREKTGEGQYIE